MKTYTPLSLFIALTFVSCCAWTSKSTNGLTRRQAVASGFLGTIVGLPQIVQALEEPSSNPDSFNVESYLKTGMVQNPMGVSGQAGKSRPETGVLLRDGSDVSRDGRTGDVLAEILVQSQADKTQKVPVLASFASPWPLAVGSVFDVECRNAATGEGSFLAVSAPTGSRSLNELDDTFFVNQLIKPTGRFSFYGAPTDVKIKEATTQGEYRFIDIGFSTLSQSTNAEIPRRARIVATIPSGTTQAVMLVGSASATRWRQGSQSTITQVANSFRAIPAPTSSMRMRAKERRSSL